MALSRKSFPFDPNNPLETHYWYYQEGQEQPVASVAYIYHHGFEKFRWEILYFGADNPIVVRSLAEAEEKLTAEFGEIRVQKQTK